MKYLDDWKAEVSALPNLDNKQKARMQLSRETDEGLHISGMFGIDNITVLSVFFFIIIVLSFCELGPKLIKADDVEYLLSEAFSRGLLLKTKA